MKEFPHYDQVEGWLRLEALQFASYFSEKFLCDVNFNSLEIGVHHGRCLIGLENLTPIHQKTVAVDLFESQHLNIDASGAGDLARFQSNLERYCLAPDRVIVVTCDSMDLDTQSLGEKTFGLISIDGGHTARHTFSDLNRSEVLMHPSGLVMLDDILNPEWTGVVTGALRYFDAQRASCLVPFALGFGKLFCCHFSRKQTIFQSLLRDSDKLQKIGIAVSKKTEFSDHEILYLKLIGESHRPSLNSSVRSRSTTKQNDA